MEWKEMALLSDLGPHPRMATKRCNPDHMPFSCWASLGIHGEADGTRPRGGPSSIGDCDSPK